MAEQVKIWIIKGFLIFNTLILLGSFIGSSFFTQIPQESDETVSNESSEDHSTGSATFNFISYKAIVPGFHFYIPLSPVLAFVIEISTPYGYLVDHIDPVLSQGFQKLLFGSIICANAP